MSKKIITTLTGLPPYSLIIVQNVQCLEIKQTFDVQNKPVILYSTQKNLKNLDFVNYHNFIYVATEDAIAHRIPKRIPTKYNHIYKHYEQRPKEYSWSIRTENGFDNILDNINNNVTISNKIMLLLDYKTLKLYCTITNLDLHLLNKINKKNYIADQDFVKFSEIIKIWCEENLFNKEQLNVEDTIFQIICDYYSYPITSIEITLE